MLLRDLAHRGQVAVLRQHDADVHHARLHDHAGDLAGQLAQARIERVGVVEGHRDRLRDGAGGDAAAVRHAVRPVGRTDRVVVDVDPDRDAERVINL